MNRRLTNAIRFFMDECLPPIVRDNRYFMWPFFYIWFKGKNINEYMEFKTLVYQWSREEFEDFYNHRESLGKDRETNISGSSLKFILEHLDPSAQTLLDVGCGTDYFLNKARARGYEIHGCDVLKDIPIRDGFYHAGNIEQLPFADKQFDIVTCHHTLEHIIDLPQAIAELKRVAKTQVEVTLPCQRYFKYTIDEHINFISTKGQLERLMGIKNHVCENIHGDWVYIGRL